jgi:GTP-binding protein HflX
VRGVLAEVGAAELPEQIVVNKVDTVDGAARDEVLAELPGSIGVSARTGEGVDELIALIGRRLRALAHIVELAVPYDRGDVLAALHRDGEVLVEVHEATAVRVRARLPEASAGRYAAFTAP